jgi:hypothetical protein
MNMTTPPLRTLALVAACTLAACQSPNDDFAALLEGEFNNAMTRTGADDATPHTHARYMRVRIDALPGALHYVEQSYGAGADRAAIYRQRLYQTQKNAGDSGLKTFIYTINPEDAARLKAGEDPHTWARTLDAKTLTPLAPGCEIDWRKSGDDFIGEQPQGRCRITGQNGAPDMALSDTLRLNADGFQTQTIATTPDGAPLFSEARPNLRKRVRFYVCTFNPGGGARLHDQDGEAATELGLVRLRRTERGLSVSLLRDGASVAHTEIDSVTKAGLLAGAEVACRAETVKS